MEKEGKRRKEKEQNIHIVSFFLNWFFGERGDTKVEKSVWG